MGEGGGRRTEKGHFLNDRGICIIMNKETKFLFNFLFRLHCEL